MQMMSRVSKVSVAAAVAVAVLAGACTPRMKPAGYAAGSTLAAVGTGLLVHAVSHDCSHLRCSIEAAGEGAIGTMLEISGLVVLLVAVASPSEPDASSSSRIVVPPTSSPAVTEEQREPEGRPVMSLVPRGPARASVRLGFD
jgi:hypothetical protein